MQGNEGDYINKKRQIETETDLNLQREIESTKESGEVAYANLTTDEKVLARVTDGIYRQPASAIRELISNAYDADAENVWIDTDVPRFKNIVVRDDGNGMSSAELTNLIRHIGGSAKRDTDKKHLHVSSELDPSISPVKKRKLIGKIGIGLFSVAQLTREFFITTKKAGESHYLEAHVILNNYTDKPDSSEYESRGQSFSSGRVAIKAIKTANINDHGTSIFLKNIKESARSQLRSSEIWTLDAEEQVFDPSNSKARVRVPKFHIGSIHRDNPDFLAEDDNLPWTASDSSDTRFSRLYDAMIDLAGTTVSPKIHEIFDNYLGMLWNIGLSVPVDYVEQHPAELSSKEFPFAYRIINSIKGKVEPIDLSEHFSLGDLIDFDSQNKASDFNVEIDNVKIFRPIKFTNLPSTRTAVQNPVLFFGSYHNTFPGKKSTQTGGPLSFDAYIMWCPKVIPKEHNGVVLRVHNSTGTLFDETFMKYQVAEYTIKSQLVAEVFIKEGLESALNIDRESFNTSHPHYQIVATWLHSALRQVIAKYKELKREAVDANKNQRADQFREELQEVITSVASDRGFDPTELRPVLFDSPRKDTFDSYNFNLSEVTKSLAPKYRKGAKSALLMEKMSAVVSVLDLYNLLENMDLEDQQSLVSDLASVIYSGNE